MNTKASILLVDDEPDIIEILEIALRDEGMEVCRAASAKAALELLRKNDFDIVISDIRMPDMSGVELLKEAKQLAPDTVFILITAYASTDTAIEALQHGAYDYLTKPFKMEELLEIVRNSLEKKSLKHEATSLQTEMEAQQGQKLFQALNRSRLVGKSQKMLEVYRTVGTVAMGTKLPRGRTIRSCRSIAAPSRRPFSKASCLGT
jgi:two-component system response regulator PilR (NtrC family)